MDLIELYLYESEIDAEIWFFDPSAKDDVYDTLYNSLTKNSFDETMQISNFSHRELSILLKCFEKDDINSLNSLILRIKNNNVIMKLLYIYQRDKFTR